LLAALEEVTQTPLAVNGAALEEVCRRLQAGGYGPEDVRRTATWLESQEWWKGNDSPTPEQILKYVAKAKSPPNPKRGGNRARQRPGPGYKYDSALDSQANEPVR
jgi:hypothetical protein